MAQIAEKYVHLFAGEKTMEYVSGIWGRTRLLSYLRGKIRKGSTVVDLGCGTGYPTLSIANLVGEQGKVFGYDKSKIFIQKAEELYGGRKNLVFAVRDITKGLPHDPETIDVFVSCMMIQNLKGKQIDRMFSGVRQGLKDGGCGVFLTLHPDIFHFDWDVDFIRYNSRAIEKWRKGRQDDLKVNGLITSTSGDIRPVFAYTHSRGQVEELIRRNGMEVAEDVSIFIDEKTAVTRFGENSIKKLPTVPLFWIVAFKKADTVP